MEGGKSFDQLPVSKEREIYKVRKICPVCKKDGGEMESTIDKDSHVMCPECIVIERRKAKEVIERMKNENKKWPHIDIGSLKEDKVE